MHYNALISISLYMVRQWIMIHVYTRENCILKWYVNDDFSTISKAAKGSFDSSG